MEMAYCLKWWDADTMTVKKGKCSSGETEEDVLRKVVNAMWWHLQKKNPHAIHDDVNESNDVLPRSNDVGKKT